MSFIMRTQPWVLAFLSGIIIGLSYLPFHLGFFAYFGFIPLFHIWLNHDYKTNIQSGYIFGLVYNTISNYWMATNSGAEFSVVIFSLISAVFYLSIYWGIAGAIVGLLRKKSTVLICLPFLIVSLEWIRSFGPLGFPWGNLALTQTNYLPILQYNDYAGPYIVSFFIILMNNFIYKVIFNINITLMYQITFFFVLVFFFIGGWLRIFYHKPSLKTIDVSVIQPNIDPNKKWDYANRENTIIFMDSLHTEAINQDPDIILFPETALPTYLRLNNRLKKSLQNKVNESGIPILIGTVDRVINSSGKKIYHNSAMYLHPFKEYEMYEKIHLVPFAEYDLMPNISIPLGKLNLNIDRGIFKGGKDYKVFRYKTVNFSDLICYESSFPRYAREFVKNGAKILMIQANDGWLGESAGPYQHFENARLRAIENRIPIVRSANTGISGVISPTGQIQRKIPLGKETVFMETISINSSLSFYSKYGDVFAAISFVIFLFIGPVNCTKND